MIWENYLIKQKDTAVKLGISKEGVGHTINLLGFRKVLSRWVHENWLVRWKVKEILGRFEEKGDVISVVGSDVWWSLGPSLWCWEQTTVYGILPQRITSPKEIQNQSLWWKSQVDCILELWRCYAYWLPRKRCYSKLRTLHWNLKNLQKRIMRKGAETDDVLLQQDTARPLTNAATCDTIAHMGFLMLLHPAKSPDLIPSNFHLFPKQKEISGAKTSILMKKSSLLLFSGGRKGLVLGWNSKTC